MKVLLLLLCVLSLCVASSSVAEEEMKKVLFVVTNHDHIEKINKSTGAYASEITHPYKVFKDAGYEIDFISPRGGNTPLDGMDSLDKESATLIKGPELGEKLQNTMKPREIKAENYAALFFAGGHGTMFDLPDNEELQQLTSTIYENGGVVAAVCHGSAALVNVKLSNGNYLVSGKEVSSFTNEEEDAMKLSDAMPFLLETTLRERGATFIKAEKFKRKIASSERLVTGQNPDSATGVAEEVVRLLDRQ